MRGVDQRLDPDERGNRDEAKLRLPRDEQRDEDDQRQPADAEKVDDGAEDRGDGRGRARLIWPGARAWPTFSKGKLKCDAPPAIQVPASPYVPLPRTPVQPLNFLLLQSRIGVRPQLLNANWGLTPFSSPFFLRLLSIPMRWKRPGRLSLLIVAGGLTACTRAPAADPKMVSEWMHTLYGVIRAERLSPPVASRLMAYATTALYSGLSSTERGLTPLSGQLNGLGKIPAPEDRQGYDPTITAVVAERVVLDSLLREALPTTRSSVSRLADSLTREQSARGVSDRMRDRSMELGTKIGLAVVAWSRGDGFDSTRGRPYTPPVGLAYWVNDAPANIYASQNAIGGERVRRARQSFERAAGRRGRAIVASFSAGPRRRSPRCPQ